MLVKLQNYHYTVVLVVMWHHIAIPLGKCFSLTSGLRTRGHSFKIFKESNLKTIKESRQFFANRVIDAWNCLPDYVESIE